jgi:hypothetical protein
MPAASLGAAARLRIADLLADGPRPVLELAAQAGAHEDALYRVLRALSSAGIFTETAPRTFANTEASELLRAGARGSVRDIVLWMAGEFHLRTFAELMHSLQTGGTALKKVTGMESFEYFEKDRALGELFNAAMTSFSAVLIPAVLEAYDFTGCGTLADIAGGHGFALTSVLQEHPEVRGILFDLPHVATGARTRIESLGLASRCEVIPGSFFDAVPAADHYMMKNIIHDWDDERAVLILRNCARAMRGNGKVLLIEAVIAPGNQPHFAKWMDLEMLAFPGGRERTEAEFAELFAAAGLRLARVVPTQSPVCVLEATRA